MTNEEMRQIVTDAGPLDDGITGVAQTGDNHWVIAFGEREIGVELVGEGGRVVLTAPIGVPPEEDQASVMQALLAYSMLWRETGGVRAALAAPDAPAVLIVDAFAAEMTSRLLATVAANLANKAAIWADLFAVGPRSETGRFDPSAFVHSMIRV